MTDETYVAAVAAEHLANAPEAVAAFLAERPLPVLELKNGYRIFHGAEDTVADLFYEISSGPASRSGAGFRPTRRARGGTWWSS